MLQSPHSFIPLITEVSHDRAHTFLFRGDELLVDSSGAKLADPAIVSTMTHAVELHAVGKLDEIYCQTGWVDSHTPAPEGTQFRRLRALFGEMDIEFASVAARAIQIAEWARTHRYCGACASTMQRVTGERCYKCTNCSMMAYPRISPAMMVLIRKDDSLLLALHANSPTGRYTALAGFLEAGESIEEAIHREVFEEVGLRVHNLKYFSSQSWPFPHSLMIAFTADYLSGEIKIDPSEISDARWFGPNDTLPELATGVSIASVLINAHLPENLRP